jgi:chromosome segregation ATPase
MANEPIKDAVGTASIWLGGGGVLMSLGVLLRGLLSGASGQEKELREGLSEEVASLREELRALRTDLAQMRSELNQVRSRNSRLYSERETARQRLAALEQRHGEVSTVWPADPEEKP